MVKLLLQHGADPNVVYDQGVTGAININHINIVNELLQPGADPNVVYDEGVTALAGAVNINHIDIVNELLQHGADPNLYGIYMNNATAAPLFLVTSKEIAQLLLDNGADVNMQDRMWEEEHH